MISSGVSTLVRIARVLASVSSPSAACSSSATFICIFQSGRQTASGLFAAQVAKPSFSQMSSHHFIVTRLPNHWWAISWATTDATIWRCSTDPVASSTSRARSRNVIAPAFSIAPAAKSGMPMMSSLPNGYLMSK